MFLIVNACQVSYENQMAQCLHRVSKSKAGWNAGSFIVGAEMKKSAMRMNDHAGDDVHLNIDGLTKMKKIPQKEYPELKHEGSGYLYTVLPEPQVLSSQGCHAARCN
jgi:hypothetical protein